MTRRAAATTACAGLLAIIVASVAPAADACFEITRMLQNKTFVANAYTDDRGHRFRRMRTLEGGGLRDGPC